MATVRVKRKRRRRQRQVKIRYLRRRIQESSDLSQRNKLVDKLRRISPRAPIPGD